MLFGGVGLLAVAALRDRPALQYPGYVLIAGAVMTKGPLAFVLCGLAMGLAIAMSADVRRRLLGLHWIAGVGIAVAISAPWFVYMYLRFRGDFVAGYLLDENIRLFATDRFGDQPPFWFYFQILATGMLPWTGVVIGRLVDDVRAAVSRQRRDSPGSVDVLLWAWTIAIVGFFTFSRFKLDHYVFPAAPALCLLIARAWGDLRAFPDSPENRGARMGLRLVGPLLVMLGAAAAYFLLAQLELPAAALIVPAVVIAGGVLITVRANVRHERPPRVPWIALTAVTTIYAGILLFVMPALEKQKVVPEIARWVASHAEPGHADRQLSTEPMEYGVPVLRRPARDDARRCRTRSSSSSPPGRSSGGGPAVLLRDARAGVRGVRGRARRAAQRGVRARGHVGDLGPRAVAPGGPRHAIRRRHFARWNGTLVTTVFGRKSSAPLMSSARWLCSRCCHHCAGTNSGRITVT